ncbi:hypothetical protein HDG34_004090 [Paraburkholderia sp. HC6.4b]|uniref:hypothetical protein n=1 Tax=unclassified Paraburkholderia TaxID=2615204 RepID=UPI00160F85A3|nr:MULTISPECIES: hypothetical protein [unclassified Paraburkholderia]MBB5410137.1 hypothetical protein [Paraburkholderia sp. HC6.4b]MBB5451948.1 hypothetical protein [Paraburkholderia sp. Kb1A]
MKENSSREIVELLTKVVGRSATHVPRGQSRRSASKAIDRLEEIKRNAAFARQYESAPEPLRELVMRRAVEVHDLAIARDYASALNALGAVVDFLYQHLVDDSGSAMPPSKLASIDLNAVHRALQFGGLPGQSQQDPDDDNPPPVRR